MYCPKCNNSIEEKTTTCNICGQEIPQYAGEWVVAGHIEDKISSDFAGEILNSYEIPNVVISKSGYFGNIGLSFGAFFSGKAMLFEVLVPESYLAEGNEVLKMTLGDRWKTENK